MLLRRHYKQISGITTAVINFRRKIRNKIFGDRATGWGSLTWPTKWSASDRCSVKIVRASRISEWSKAATTETLEIDYITSIDIDSSAGSKNNRTYSAVKRRNSKRASKQSRTRGIPNVNLLTSLYLTEWISSRNQAVGRSRGITSRYRTDIPVKHESFHQPRQSIASRFDLFKNRIRRILCTSNSNAVEQRNLNVRNKQIRNNLNLLVADVRASRVGSAVANNTDGSKDTVTEINVINHSSEIHTLKGRNGRRLGVDLNFDNIICLSSC